jgi:antirestriction protein ArdC
VFNCEQIEGLPPHFYMTATPPKSDMERIVGAESFAAATGATMRHGGDRAYYSVTNDYVQMPPFDCFRNAESYYATLLHELTHNAVTGVMPHRAETRRPSLQIGDRVRHNPRCSNNMEHHDYDR